MADEERPEDRDPVEVSEAAPGARWSRREFGRGLVGATIASGLFAGCRPCFPPTPGGDGKSRRFWGPRTFTVRGKILPGKFRELSCLLDDPDHNPFETAASGIHYARFFVTEQGESLFFMVIYDDYWNAIDFLRQNAKGVDRVFDFCAGYPSAGAANPTALDGFVREHLECVELFYRAYDNAQAEVRDALTLRDNFLNFLEMTDGGSDAKLRAAYAKFLQDPNLMNHDRDDGNDVPGNTSGDGVLMLPANSPDRVNPFTLMARVHDEQLPRLKRTLRAGTFANIDLGSRPLRNLPTLHFARVSIVHENHMLFASVYDGDFVQYVEDFSSRIAKDIDTVFGACVGYPLAGSRDVFAFRDFLRAHQIKTSAFGGGYLSRSLLQIKSSLELSHALAKFARRVDPNHPRLSPKLRHFLRKHQGLLT